MSGPLTSLIRREVAIARRIGGSGSMGVVFLLVLTTIVPFAIGPDLNLLRRIGPAILWIAALLAMLLGLDRLFRRISRTARSTSFNSARRRSNSSFWSSASPIG